VGDVVSGFLVVLDQQYLHRRRSADDQGFWLLASMVASRSAKDCLQAAGSGLLARNASSARSIALSTVCHSAGERGLSEGSASSQVISRSLIRVFAPPRSPFSTRDAVSTTMARYDERSPSFGAVAARAGALIRAGGSITTTPNMASAASTETVRAILNRFLIISRPSM